MHLPQPPMPLSSRAPVLDSSTTSSSDADAVLHPRIVLEDAARLVTAPAGHAAEPSAGPLTSRHAVEEPARPGGDFSIRGSMTGAVVLLTGCTGYVGSLVLEQLLRCCPGVVRIYALVRSGRGLTAEERVARLMRTGLFHNVRNKPELLAKVVVVTGDMVQAGLGIAPEVLARIEQETTVVIHNAARIALEDPIQTTLTFNYCGTRRLLEMSQRFRHIASFVHVSTAFVNINLDSHTTVLEKIYPMMLGDHKVEHATLVSQLMALDPQSAEIKAKVCMQMWGFNNTYCMGKHLTEQLVASYHGRLCPVAIMRPALVAAVCGQPYPGYVGNLAGPAGFIMAFALGFFNKNSAAWHSSHILDCVPGDVASSLVVAAAAANLHDPRRAEPLVLHAASSSINPMTHMEAYANMWHYFKRFPAPYKLAVGEYWRLHEYKKEYIPTPWKMRLAKRITAAKVKTTCSLLKLLNMDRQARKLKIGHRAWAEANVPKYDISLFFSVAHAVDLEERLVADERADFMLTWRGDWYRFQNTYSAALMHKQFGQLPPAVTDLAHDYVHVADLPDPTIVVVPVVQRRAG